MGLKQWARYGDKRLERLLLEFPENTPNRHETIAFHLQVSVEEVKHHYEALVNGQCPTTKHMKKEKKRGKHWTEEEHRWFLEGLAKYGRGDWKNVSSKSVKTRTPTQVASHAQKYFLRQEAENKAKQRSSIHDITLIDNATNNGPAT